MALSNSNTTATTDANFADGATLHGRWVIVSKLGNAKGYYNQGIYLVRDMFNDDGNLFILKCLPSEGLCKDVAHRETDIMSKLNHPNIPQLYDLQADRSQDGSPWIVMEYCEGGSLLNLVQQCQGQGHSIPESFVWHVIECIARALHYCHHGPDAQTDDTSAWDTIAHRDISLANIFLGVKPHCNRPEPHPIVKLGDFGCSVAMSEVQAKGWDISKLTLVSSGLPPSGMDISANESGDVFVLGFVLYCIYTITVDLIPCRELHFDVHDVRNAQRAVPYTTAFIKLMKRCLSADATDHPTAEVLLEAASAVREMRI